MPVCEAAIGASARPGSAPVRLTPSVERIAALLHAAGTAGMTTEELLLRLYGRDGGPDSAEACLRQFIKALRVWLRDGGSALVVVQPEPRRWVLVLAEVGARIRRGRMTRQQASLLGPLQRAAGRTVGLPVLRAALFRPQHGGEIDLDRSVRVVMHQLRKRGHTIESEVGVGYRLVVPA